MALFIALFLIGSCFGDLPPRADPLGFKLVFEDDFNGKTLNPQYWNVLDGYVQTQYDMVCYTGDNAYVENGNLVIRTRVQRVTCVDGGFNPTQQTKVYDYASGFVDTVGKVAVRNGRVEIRAKLPPPTLRIWPAGWTISDKNQRDKGPLCCERGASLSVSLLSFSPFSRSHQTPLYPPLPLLLRAP